MRTIIAGSRHITDYSMMKSAIEKAALVDVVPTVVISGCAVGVDTMGEMWAMENGIPIERYPALWGKHGKSAGPVRNEQMIVEGRAEALIAVWDFKSRGTNDMIRRARRHHLKMVVYDCT